MRTQVPFRLIGGEQPLVVVSARFNDGAAVDCAVDTGASHAMLLPEVGRRLGIAIRETRDARGAAGAIRVDVGSAETIAVGDIVARDVPVLLTPELERIGAAIGHRLQGNLGHSLLGRYRLTLDYERLELTLATGDEPVDARPARAHLDFTLAHPSKPLLMVPALVEGQPFAFAVDTGASTTVVSADVMRRCGATSVASTRLTGGAGTVAAEMAVIPSLQLADVKLSRVRVMVGPFLEGLGAAVGTRIDGIVGTNVLRRFRVTIDYPRNSLRLD